MDQRKAMYALCAVYTAAMLILTYILQTYQLTYREEADIFLYDNDYILTTVASPGGFALILMSFCSQFFIFAWAGPLIVTCLYAIVILCLIRIMPTERPLSLSALALLPCLCMMLCFENMSFRTFGLMAFMLCVASLLLYDRVAAVCSTSVRTVLGIVLCAVMYWAAGSAALMLAISGLLLDCCRRRRLCILGIIYPAATVAVAYAAYQLGYVHTLRSSFTPDMYYEMGSTFYLMLYALCMVPVYILIVFICRSVGAKLRVAKQCVIAAIIMVVEIATALNLYGAVHSRSNYETQQQRYYARAGEWGKIMRMPYGGQQTPYTSYRFLALAHEGQLAQRIGEYRPFISYLLENKPKVKRLDQQVYSDIYYDCDYMAAARKAAFDTDIVTPGPFNPYETRKLAEINIVYGDYAVADKLLAMLEKTLYYSDWATAHRRFLYDDDAVEADPVLGPKRRAIPAHNDYMSPKGIQRDLKYIIGSNSSQVTAKEFYKAFKILTNQNEDI